MKICTQKIDRKCGYIPLLLSKRLNSHGSLVLDKGLNEGPLTLLVYIHS